MAYYNAETKQRTEYNSSSWFPGANGSTPVELSVRVTISAHPHLLKGPFVKTFLVSGGASELLQVVPGF
jgi:hypothetical protein